MFLAFGAFQNCSAFALSICNTAVFLVSQATELAEFTAKIALLEEAKRKKEDEATEWQHKVLQLSLLVEIVKTE